MTDETKAESFANPKASELSATHFVQHLHDAPSLEVSGNKDWPYQQGRSLCHGQGGQPTVCRSATITYLRSRCYGPDYRGARPGIATTIGHAPQVPRAAAPAGSRVAIAEVLTNLISAPLKEGLKSVSLSANWMRGPAVMRAKCSDYMPQ